MSPLDRIASRRRPLQLSEAGRGDVLHWPLK
jgi:hypothetical protein